MISYFIFSAEHLLYITIPYLLGGAPLFSMSSIVNAKLKIYSFLSNNSKDIQVSVYTTILPEVIQEEVNAGPIPKKKTKNNTEQFTENCLHSDLSTC